MKRITNPETAKAFGIEVGGKVTGFGYDRLPDRWMLVERKNGGLPYRLFAFWKSPRLAGDKSGTVKYYCLPRIFSARRRGDCYFFSTKADKRIYLCHKNLYGVPEFDLGDMRVLDKIPDDIEWLYGKRYWPGWIVDDSDDDGRMCPMR